MTGDDYHPSLEYKAQDLKEQVEAFVESVCEARGEEFEPWSQPLTTFEETDEELGSLIAQIKKSDALVTELSMTSVIGTLIDLRGEDSNQNRQKVALVMDLAITVINRSSPEDISVRTDLPYILLITLLQSTPVDWLLDFWSFFELRGVLLRYIRGVPLSSKKYPGSGVLRALNEKLNQLRGNNENKRDILKSKILFLTAQLFTAHQPFLTNQKSETNTLITPEHQFESTQKSSLFVKFWKMQEMFEDPFAYLLSVPSLSDLNKDIDQVLKLVIDYDTQQKSEPPIRDNSAECYYRTDLSEEKRKELGELYDKKTFTPSFFIDENRFLEQLKSDASLRTTFLVQFYFFANTITRVLDDKEVPDLKHNKRIRLMMSKFAKNNAFSKDFDFLIEYQNRAVKALDKRHKELKFSVVRAEFEELSNLRMKLNVYTSFTTTYGVLSLDNQTRETLQKFNAVPKRYWAKYGSSQITKHWNLPTGLDRLVKSENDNTRERVMQQIEDYREVIKAEPQSRDLNTWKALRLARGVSLSKFTQVNQKVGLEGLFDGTLKAAYDDEKREREIKKREVEEKKEQQEQEMQEKKKQQEDERRKEVETQREEMARKKLASHEESNAPVELTEEEQKQKDEEERKRKASQDLFDENKKRMKLETSKQASDDLDLDY